MQHNTRTRPVAVRILVALLVLLGGGAVPSGSLLILAPGQWPDALNPFKSLHWSWAASLVAGAILMIWIIVEVIMLRVFAFLHALYLVWGIALALLPLLPGVRRYYARERMP